MFPKAVISNVGIPIVFGIGQGIPAVMPLEVSVSFDYSSGSFLNNGDRVVIIWTGSGTFYTPVTMPVDLLVVGGGGSGNAGGGGAGGLLYTSSYTISEGTYVITVGPGAIGGVAVSGSVGGNSSFGALLVAYGGQGATSGSKTSGSGGGGEFYILGNPGPGGINVGGQGHNGGNSSEYLLTTFIGSGGGGGAGTAGSNGSSDISHGVGGAGGNGASYSITGTASYYAGGGGGAGATSNANGGLGGGGNAGGSDSNKKGTDGLGGGGGGGDQGGPGGGSGGIGTVIISFNRHTVV